MLVTHNNLSSVLTRLKSYEWVSLDTETTGLFPYNGDRLFSIIIGAPDEVFYFNFKDYVDVVALSFDTIRDISNSICNLYMHNAKFDMAFLGKEQFSFEGKNIHCTQAIGRIERNDRLSYSLDNLGKELGYDKFDTVKKYCNTNKLFKVVQIPGKKSKEKQYSFHEVPLDIIQPYAEMDARITFELGEHQRKLMTTETPDKKSSYRVYLQEMALTKVLYRMEKYGLTVDKTFCERAKLAEESNYKQEMEQFEFFSGKKFLDSGKLFKEIFDNNGFTYGKTEKGNASFTSTELEKHPNPLTKIILRYRDAYKRANTYYGNFLYFGDSNNVLHCDFKQSGTSTGRMSCVRPNLQNLTKEDDEQKDLKIRRAFVPRANHSFVMIDYDQMEYRLMLEYAKEEKVIAQVLAGLDVHQATANLMGVDRRVAKTINFMLLYGGGAQKLANELGISLVKAKDYREIYFIKLPRVKAFINKVMETAKKRKVVYNWLGRANHFADENFAYAAPNHLIQGGCADIVKKAMVELDAFLSQYHSRMVCQIHDEILFEVHNSEWHIIPELKRIMETAYPHKLLPLTCGVEWSDISWADKKEYIP